MEDGGAFHTQDAGREWEEGMNGMKEVHIATSVAVDRRFRRPVWDTTGGMYRSDDGAMSWKRINNGLIPESELMASMHWVSMPSKSTGRTLTSC